MMNLRLQSILIYVMVMSMNTLRSLPRQSARGQLYMMGDPAVMELKASLFAEAATCDRGFSAGPSQRGKIDEIIDSLAKLSSESEPTRGLTPDNGPDIPCPLAGNIVNR